MAARQLLARATESTAAPTPGYLYKDLTQAASANPSACAEMAQYLTQRLATKANPNIKYKCLKVIAKLCEGVPRNQFRRAISQNPHGVGAIKDALNFRGPLDAVRGDEPNQKVRAAAQEALDAVYREAATSEVAHTQSYGGPGISSSYAPSPHHHSRMTGMGNPRYTDPRLEQSSSRYVENANLKAVVREAGEVIAGMIKDPLARNIEVGVPRQGHSGNLPGYGNPNVRTLWHMNEMNDSIDSLACFLTALCGSSTPRLGRTGPPNGWSVDHGQQPRTRGGTKSPRTRVLQGPRYVVQLGATIGSSHGRLEWRRGRILGPGGAFDTVGHHYVGAGCAQCRGGCGRVGWNV